MKTMIKTDLNENGAKQKRNSVVLTPKTEQLENANIRSLGGLISRKRKQMHFWEIVWTPIDRYPFLSENEVVWTEKKTAPFLGAKTDQNENRVMWT